VLWAHEIAADFHARFSATARHYTYLLLTRPERPGLIAGRVGWYHRPLDLEAVRSGAAALIGMHDFSSFRGAECQARSPVKTIHRIDLARDGDLMRFEISADAYLHHMIRNIIGALVYVGSGRQPPGWIGALLDARDRTGADYDARFGLPPTRRAIALPSA
jgi:tRNA pseudouridine38-40 synthase